MSLAALQASAADAGEYAPPFWPSADDPVRVSLRDTYARFPGAVRSGPQRVTLRKADAEGSVIRLSPHFRHNGHVVTI